MTRFALQPRWLAWHLLLVAVLVAFGWLGRWQLLAFGTDDDTRPDASPVAPLDRVTAAGARLDAASAGRRVTVSGSYLPGQTLLAPGRSSPDGGGSGSWLVTPLRTERGVLAVVRGWVPDESSAGFDPPAGTVRVVGLLQRSETGPPDAAATVADRGELAYVATVTLLDALPYRAAELYDGYLAMRAERPAADVSPVPVAAQPPAGDGVGRWRNLAYGLQWWFFGAAAVFFWWLVLSRAWRERSAAPPAPASGPPALSAPPRRT